MQDTGFMIQDVGYMYFLLLYQPSFCCFAVVEGRDVPLREGDDRSVDDLLQASDAHDSRCPDVWLVVGRELLHLLTQFIVELRFRDVGKRQDRILWLAADDGLGGFEKRSGLDYLQVGKVEQ
jgi:hypothetical protein